MAGQIHPLLRTLMLGRELLNKRDRQIQLAIGEAIGFNEIKGFDDHKQLVNYLRLNTYLLEANSGEPSTLWYLSKLITWSLSHLRSK